MADFEKEWARVKANPPHVILSEELRAILPEEFTASSAESTSSKSVKIDTKVEFAKQQAVQGTLLSFSKSNLEHMYTLECSAAEAMLCLAECDVEKITFTPNIDSDTVFMVKKDRKSEASEIAVDFLGPQNTTAILTIKIFRLPS
jgi:hypothetical protein